MVSRMQPPSTRTAPAISLLACLALSACGGGSSGGMAMPVTTTAPAPAAAHGYTMLTYGPNPQLLDSTTQASGVAGLFDWSFVGQTTGGSATANGDGSISLIGSGNSAHAQVASATRGAAPGSFVGIAFGGGAYFDAVIKFDGWQGQSANAGSLVGGWPNFWGMAIEHLAQNNSDQVPGEPSGYEDFAEVDFMEYNIAYTQQSDDVYSGSILNWYGIYAETCPSPPKIYCVQQNSYDSKLRSVAASVNFSDYHHYGALWVPATATTDGYIEWYFDGQAIGATASWSKLQNAGVMPPSPPFAILDQQHLAVMLGTGSQYPMTVQSVSVWQRSAANNLVQ